MKISNVKVIIGGNNWVIVKVETDNGLVGFGEATLEIKQKTVATAVKQLRRYLIGADPFKIEDLWQMMYRSAFWRGGPILNSAISGVEQALWDIIGKSLEQPVYNLLGGLCRNKIRLYAALGGWDRDELVDNAKKLVEAGYTAMKMNPYLPISLKKDNDEVKEVVSGYRLYDSVKKAFERVEAVRDAVGERIDIMLDCHGRSSIASLPTSYRVLLCKELEPLRPLWIEEPVRPDCPGSLKAFASKVKIPVATGERLYTKFQFNEVLDDHVVDIIQPDLCHAGGILEGKKIAAMAEAHNTLFAPHCPGNYSSISLYVAMQLDACTPNFLIQECGFIKKRGVIEGKCLTESFKVEDGFVKIPNSARATSLKEKMMR
jgi:galactonate dehydratase